MFCVTLLFSLAACGGDSTPDSDAGTRPDASTGIQDAGFDVDAGADAGTQPEDDAGTDAGTQPEEDAGTDAGIDAGTEDAGTKDAGTEDAGIDAGTEDAGTEPVDAGSPLVCGDGKKEGDEVCDDGNTTSGDGCNASCLVEAGWNCGASGLRCHAAGCGDGIIAAPEECEDGNTANDDGCNATCRLEPGYMCQGVGQRCMQTTCGDGKKEGTEHCDDGNNDLGDGCSPLCQLEPRCVNGICEAVCGDGILTAGESCDDGNTRDFDGCSSTCQIEEGVACVLSEPLSTLMLPIVYRDFRGKDQLNGHIDFQNANGQETGIVQAALGPNGKPVYAKTGTSSLTTHGQANFDQWFHDVVDVNQTVVSTLPLSRTSSPSTLSYLFEDTSFFPLDGKGWVAVGEETTRPDSAGAPHNFSFTSETRFWFEYTGQEQLVFTGDDDVWVFINGKLAIDMGGVHGSMTSTVDLAGRASALGLQPDRIYEVAVFQAERFTTGSSYKLQLSSFLPANQPRRCTSACGNGRLDEGEECDAGPTQGQGGYGQCAPGCLLGIRCGDAVVQFEHGEHCDDGNTVSGDGCDATCKLEL
ncbi:hypothetical protein COCOR_01479 [Corallococcus coralloides DSM 2259]|uniref:PA14 domain-containing protein n=1 Tax=Corallococcus coralloides (strain ATCC 25202 / DSM 2259 / NBRC 100086 / M2) TaxID=1144275 RepID=H8MVC9_CORCM|nr:hypothetical protein COCOR_01479 [Corallococcus coralloides DSM 2259]